MRAFAFDKVCTLVNSRLVLRWGLWLDGGLADLLRAEEWQREFLERCAAAGVHENAARGVRHHDHELVREFVRDVRGVAVDEHLESGDGRRESERQMRERLAVRRLRVGDDDLQIERDRCKIVADLHVGLRLIAQFIGARC